MGQKTNPNIIQLNKTNAWNSNYIEKTSKDFHLHTIKDIEIKKFIVNFFKASGLIIQNCKLNYANNNLTIFLMYQQTYNSIGIIKEIDKEQNLKIKKEIIPLKKNMLQKQFYALKSIKNYFNYKNTVFYKQNTLKKRLLLKKVNTIKRLKIINFYKKYLSLKENKTIANSFAKSFLNTLFNSLSVFYINLNNITLIIKSLSNNSSKNMNEKKFVNLKKKLIKLRKYQRNDFFKDGINSAFSTVTNKNSSEMLAVYIANTLKKLKRHNFFFKFLKTLLTIFITKNLINTVKGIKIKIKGRINGAPRAKNKIINIGKAMPLFTIDSSINYAETTAYTANGTLGIKVWIYEKK